MNPPQLRMIATGWTFANYPGAKKKWKDAEIVKAIKKEGFDGLCAAPGSPRAQLVREAGLELLGGIDIGSVSEAERKLRPYRDDGFIHINVQVCNHDTTTEKALPVVIKIIEVGDKLGLKPAIEWHRDTCTETPEKAWALADAYRKKTGRKLRMNFDHSHPAIIKHLHPGNYWERMGLRLDLLRMGELIHFRPFNGHHCQIPITDGKGKLSPEFKQWLPFCDKVLEAWLQGAKPGRTLYVVPELGPKGGYGLSCFPDTWTDKKVLAREIRKLWKKQIKRWKK